MVWEQLSINKPHLAYLIIGGFTSLFMLCSLFVKERLYIGEATVASLCGVIFGPHAADVFSPSSWGNTDQITLECSRVVLVVQCFAVGVELPKAYMERHWRSVTFLLVPVMTYGWLITSLFIWWMIEPLTWLESLMCAACVTATDPVLASSVVGKGKFAKRVPRHLRDLLSAESGCNDGMAFPFIYLSFYLIHYHLGAKDVSFHWFCNTILYECVFGAIYGVLIGYMGRHAIKWADRNNLVDRESFLVFYFVLALFCAGTGALLGTDDLLVGFAAGVGFSNDGWFTQKTEESHVSNVIDLLLNLAYFIYLGAVIPWEQFNNPLIGLTPWRLSVVAILVILFRRIPIVLALKPLIPDIKTWREALFAGHFGPIGVGAIFAAILARAELETDTTTPLAEVPTDPSSVNYNVIQIIWPLTTFLVVTSILVHGSSIAVFTLGKRINNFTLTMSYTQANEEGPTWMNRLPRIASTARSSMSKSRDDYSATPSEERQDYPPGTLPPVGFAGNFLRRQREEDTPIQSPRATRSRSRRRPRGHVEQSAITPMRLSEKTSPEDSFSSALNEKTDTPDSSSDGRNEQNREDQSPAEPDLEIYQEGDQMVVEDREGNVVSVHDTKGESSEEKRQQVLRDEKKLHANKAGKYAPDKDHPHPTDDTIEPTAEDSKVTLHPAARWRKLSKTMGSMHAFKRPSGHGAETPTSKPRNPDATTEEVAHEELHRSAQAAHAYQFGNTLIVEDEDGEVIRKIDLGSRSHQDASTSHAILERMGSWAGFGAKKEIESSDMGEGEASKSGKKGKKPSADEIDDSRLRFTVPGGRRLSKAEFVAEVQAMDTRHRRQMVDQSSGSTTQKEEIKALVSSKDRAIKHAKRAVPNRSKSHNDALLTLGPLHETEDTSTNLTANEKSRTPSDLGSIPRPASADRAIPQGRPSTESNDTLPPRQSAESDAPQDPDIARALRRRAPPETETAAQRRRREAAAPSNTDTEADPDPDADLPRTYQSLRHDETTAERRRRLAALGEISNSDSDSESNEDQQVNPDSAASPSAPPRIRFAESVASGAGKERDGEGEAGLRSRKGRTLIEMGRDKGRQIFRSSKD